MNELVDYRHRVFSGVMKEFFECQLEGRYKSTQSSLFLTKEVTFLQTTVERRALCIKVKKFNVHDTFSNTNDKLMGDTIMRLTLSTS